MTLRQLEGAPSRLCGPGPCPARGSGAAPLPAGDFGLLLALGRLGLRGEEAVPGEGPRGRGGRGPGWGFPVGEGRRGRGNGESSVCSRKAGDGALFIRHLARGGGLCPALGRSQE